MLKTALWLSMALLGTAIMVSAFWELSPQLRKRPYGKWMVLLWGLSFGLFYAVLGTAGLMTQRPGVRLVGIVMLAMSSCSFWKGAAVIRGRAIKA